MHARDPGVGLERRLRAAVSGGALARRAVVEPGTGPPDRARKEGSEHGTRRADQRDIAAAAVTELLAAQRAEPGADESRADDPRDEALPVHPPILASAAAAAGQGPHTLAG